MGTHSYLNSEYEENSSKLKDCESRINETVLISEPAGQFSLRDSVQVSSFNSVIGDLNQLLKDSLGAYMVNKLAIDRDDALYASRLDDSISDIIQLKNTLNSITEVMNMSEQTGVNFHNGMGTCIEGYIDSAIATVKLSDYVTKNESGTYEYNWDGIRFLFMGTSDYEKASNTNPSVTADKAYKTEYSDGLSDSDYMILLMIVNSFVNEDGSINDKALQYFLELSCTDGYLFGNSNNTDCGSVLHELAKMCTRENKILSSKYNVGIDETDKEKVANLIVVNNIVVATANVNPQPDILKFTDVNLSKVNQDGTIVSQPSNPQKRIDIPLKKETDSKTGISYWYVGDYAVVYEYNDNATGTFAMVEEQLDEDVKKDVNKSIDELKVDVPEADFFSDTGNTLDAVGIVCDALGLIPVVGDFVEIVSVTADCASIFNDLESMASEEEEAIAHNKKVDSVKSEVAEIIDRFKTVDEQQKNTEAMGAGFSAVYYRKSGRVSLNDYNIDKEDFQNNISQYNRQNHVKDEDKIDTEEIVKEIENNELSEENKRKLDTYLEWYSCHDINDSN